MLQVQPFEKYAAKYEEWFEQHPYIFQSELTALKMQLLKAGEKVQGIQVGMGSGKYALHLGIKEGVEPAEPLREIAIQNRLDAMDAIAERLPYSAMRFDFVLFATIENLDSFPKALQEAYRVLKPNGTIIVGFIPKNSPIGKQYRKEKEKGLTRFYKNASFYTPEEVREHIEQAGFINLDFVQTLFGDPENIEEMQQTRNGYGEGSYVVVKAGKK